MYDNAAQQQAAAQYAQYQGVSQQPLETPRSAQLLAQVNANIETLSNMIDALAGRVVGPREAANGGSTRGIPATYSALAEDMAKRTDDLIQRLQLIASEI